MVLDAGCYRRCCAPVPTRRRIRYWLAGSHRHLVAEAGRASGCWALALDYRLAPEHPFPAALEDAVAGYRYLLGRRLKPDRIAIAGGGGLVVAAMVAIR